MSAAPSLPSSMRAVVLSKPDASSPPVLQLVKSQPLPSLQPGQLLVKVHASAIQPSDIYNAKGGFGDTTFPRIPGRDFSGVVVAAAAGSDALAQRIGQEVFGTSGNTHGFTVDGFHAEYVAISADGVAPKPKALTHEQAATVGVPFTTASGTLCRANVKKGDTVLVLGANGSVGKTACTIASDLGCTVLKGVRGNKGDVDTAADTTLSHALELTGGRGVDVVVDTVGVPAMTAAAVNVLAHGGRLAFISAPKTATADDLAFPMKDFYRKEKSVLGYNSVAYGVERMAAELAAMQPLFESGKWREAGEGSWESIDIDDAVAAYQSQEKGKKFVIKMA